MHPYRPEAVVVLVASVALQTAMATTTLPEHWRVATALFSAAVVVVALLAAMVVVVALLAAAGAALVAALAMLQWRMVTPRHLLWYVSSSPTPC